MPLEQIAKLSDILDIHLSEAAKERDELVKRLAHINIRSHYHQNLLIVLEEKINELAAYMALIEEKLDILDNRVTNLTDSIRCDG